MSDGLGYERFNVKGARSKSDHNDGPDREILV